MGKKSRLTRVGMMEAIFPGKKRVEVKFGSFVVQTDQKEANGGDGATPEPFELFLASIVSCAGIYAKGFCDVRKIGTDRMKVTQEMEFDHETKLVKSIKLCLHVPSNFPEKYEAPILRTMDSCTVKKQLRSDIHVESKIVRI